MFFFGLNKRKENATLGLRSDLHSTVKLRQKRWDYFFFMKFGLAMNFGNCSALMIRAPEIANRQGSE